MVFSLVRKFIEWIKHIWDILTPEYDDPWWDER